MKAKIESKKIVARDTLETRFSFSGKKVDFKPGQYFYVTLPGNLTHHFTIVNSPNEEGVLSCTTRLRDSEYKNTLKALPVGTEVEIGKIEGDFTLPEEGFKPLVFVALGIGITPYVSMLRFIREEGRDDKITLIYSDSNRQSMAYLDELQAYARENPDFKIILTITKDQGWAGEKRHVNEEFIKDYFKNFKENLYFVSGPPKAVEAVAGSLRKLDISENNIKLEDFPGY